MLPLFLLVLPPQVAAEASSIDSLAVVGASFGLVILVTVAASLCGRLFRLLPARYVPTAKEVEAETDALGGGPLDDPTMVGIPVAVVAGPPLPLRAPSSI
jgi:hypothetical protein